MDFEWPTIRLGDHIDACLGKMLDAKKNKGMPQPYLGNSNVRWGQFDLNSLAEMRFESHEDERYSLLPGDLVVCEGGEPGRCAIWTGPAGMKIQKALHRIRPKETLDNYYLFYWFQLAAKSKLLEPYFTGTTIKHLTGKAIAELNLPLPPIDIQRAIVGLLKPLDDRIALLRETNATLEAMAQALFKSWFVDFDPVHANAGTRAATLPAELQALFPYTFSDTPQGLVPEGWNYQPISDVIEGLYDGPHATPPEASNGGVFLGIRNLTGTGLDLSDVRYIADMDWEKWTKRITPRKGDIVFSYEATLGFFALIPPDLRCCLGRRLALIRPLQENGTTHFWFHQFTSSPFQQLLEKHTIHGATVNRIALKSFPNLPVLAPPIEIRQAFDCLAESIWADIHANQAQAQTLATLRDTLLPRLISGQLRLPDAEAALAKAGA